MEKEKIHENEKINREWADQRKDSRVLPNCPWNLRLSSNHRLAQEKIQPNHQPQKGISVNERTRDSSKNSKKAKVFWKERGIRGI
ncbi:hypothetical protein [Parageobacillus sp. KH3-4]|uniref:hypothetical protein n=1 Tax=Parageobacillus sp. KH3-4 TaxID=2916802 RepID=UPI001FCA5D0A|nr:hypothetical protein [Parageobacillus sp. KH3-4]BDG45728.1 hypothetical protein PspKH34_02890 [Parageobacillus sp. KH3-4]